MGVVGRVGGGLRAAERGAGVRLCCALRRSREWQRVGGARALAWDAALLSSRSASLSFWVRAPFWACSSDTASSAFCCSSAYACFRRSSSCSACRAVFWNQKILR